MVCARCHTRNADDALFCERCGAPLRPQTGDEVAHPALAAQVRPGGREYAGLALRLSAWAVDLLVALILALIPAVLFVPTILIGPRAVFFLPLALLVHLLYAVLFIGLAGRTPGKIHFGIQVVDPWGGGPGLDRAFVREVPGKLLSGLALGLGFLALVRDPSRQAWHDRLAGTYVIRARGPRS